MKKFFYAFLLLVIAGLTYIGCQENTVVAPQNDKQISIGKIVGGYDIILIGGAPVNNGDGTWTWTWSVQNTNPGNGSEGTWQNLSHWNFLPGECLVIGDIVSAGYSSDGENFTSFTPKIEDDASEDCTPEDVFKFDFGTTGSTISYYRLTVNKNFLVNPNAIAYYKSGSVSGCGSGTFDGIGCFQLEVSKTATPTYDRIYTWTIDKSVDDISLLLALGQTHTVNYSVVVDATFADANYAVSGTITIINNSPYSSIITEISDVLSGSITPTLDCNITFPYTLLAGDTLECTYSADLTDAIDGINTVIVTTSTIKVVGDTATAEYDFGSPTTEIDECIDVSDTYSGTLGTVCYSDLPKTYQYPRDIGPYAECGDFQVTNIASFITNDQDSTGSDNQIINISVPCNTGCTLTQGYWKTHSTYGPAPYDDAWLELSSSGADATFFLSGKTYYQVLWTAPAGNPYYILAHQYIAAKLNILNGASVPSSVSSAISYCETFFGTYLPTSTFSKTIKNQMMINTNILDQYNNGVIGPGHCSE